MSVADVVREMESAGVRLWEESGQLRFRAPKGIMTEERRAALHQRKEAVLDYLRQGLDLEAVVPDPGSSYQPFPLTEVQGAYLLGRRETFAYGGVACHAYGEMGIPNLDPGRLEAAWQALVRRHPMLRALIQVEGSQRVLPEVPDYHIAVNDVRGSSPLQVEAAIKSVRSELDHKMHAPDQWPLFELRVTLTDQRGILHLSIDFLIADFISIHLLLDELSQLYLTPEEPLAPLSLSFRDYQLAERRLRQGSRYERDREYWWQRVDEMPSAPELPLAEQPPSNAGVRFQSWKMRLDPKDWNALRQHAGEHGVTPSGALLAAYAEVIGRWSRQPRFTLDITLLQRLPLHPDVLKLVGDFTSISLLAVDLRSAASFQSRAQGMQAQLWKDLDHRLCSGIEVIREIARRRGASNALMPVVFTSAIGLRNENAEGASADTLGEFIYSISQTPQVWIDCQVIERQGRLDLSWDVRDGVFPDGLIDDMFEAYKTLVQGLGRGPELWESASPVTLPPRQLEMRRLINDAAGPVPNRLLHQDVVAQALRTPERVAVISGFQSRSYGDLLAQAAGVADALARTDVRPHELVAVLMDKGLEQVIAVLGTLLAGAAYLPIDTDQPRSRRNRILTDAGVRIALTQSWFTTDLPDSVRAIAVDTVPPEQPASTILQPASGPDDLAYVIYTSGSTGAPKGVMITHRSALNTIEDINRRFHVTADDRILGLAHLGFDLSVYDIFGPLSVGGCLVLPASDRQADPSHWAQLIGDHDVTLWDSVPAQLQMLNDYLCSEPVVTLPSLRLAMLSGDWIPVKLPDQIRGRLPGVEVASLGGATEASIWSIVYPIGEVSEKWKSIPYGKPLANQSFHVLNAALQPCPDWTTGDLYIGGAGLASGYLGDAAKTAERFIHHPETHERLYCTGDLGRYLSDGNIEFLGREDFQVKILGHRIELAEVEAALRSHPAVASAIVLAHGDGPLDRRLAAFVELARRQNGTPSWQLLAAEVAARMEAAGAEIRMGVDGEEILRFAQQLDHTALVAMVCALRQHDLFAGAEDVHSLDEILRQARVVPKHHRLIRRWLNALEANHLLQRDPTGAKYCHLAPMDPSALTEAWQTVESLQPKVDRRTELLDYFRTAGQRLPELMHGELDPVALLFPQGRVEIHEVAYNDSFLSRYLNCLVTAAVCEIARQHAPRTPLRVLEIGAGVGGTSIELIPALAEFSVEYLFTDVSQFFLNNASERFRDYPWVKYALFDMNQDYRPQGLTPNSFDVIVCANVLHYSLNANIVLGRIRELLQPGGWLVFIDMVRDNYQVLTSMEFLFDANVNDFEDVRQGHDATFINLEQWHGLLATAGAQIARCLPHSDDPLSQIGFHVFAAQLKTDREPVTTRELGAHLADRVPEYMVPAHLEVLEALPLTANSKIDRKTLLSWLSLKKAENAATGQDEPENDLERRIAAIWAAVIGVKSVGRNQDFFEIGGDSLLAAQLVGRLREAIPEAHPVFFDSLLRLVLEGPTVAKLAAHLQISRALDAAPQPQSSALIHLAKAGDGPLRVLVHDASGTLASYSPLFAPLSAAGSLAGLVVNDSELYLQMQPRTLVENRAAKYAQLLRSENRDLDLVGYQFGGILAAELASLLVEAAVPVRSVTVIGSCPIPFQVEDELLAEYLFIHGSGVDPVRLGFPAEAALGQALAVIRSATPGLIADGQLAKLAGDPELAGVAWCFRRLAAIPQADRLTSFARAFAPPGSEPAPLSQVTLLYSIFRHSIKAGAESKMSSYAGDIVLLRPSEQTPLWPSLREDTVRFWQEQCLGELRVIDVPGNAYTCLRAEHAAHLVPLITEHNA